MTIWPLITTQAKMVTELFYIEMEEGTNFRSLSDWIYFTQLAFSDLEVNINALYVIKYFKHLLPLSDTKMDILSIAIVWGDFVAAYFSNLLRLGALLVFFGSYLLKPLIIRPTSLLWARLIGSERPIFTLIFGGSSALATAVIEVAKHV